MRKIGLAVLASGAVAVGGCGSSNRSAGTVTVTGPSTSASATTQSASAPDELRRYLSQVDAQQQDYVAARTRVLETIARAERGGSVAAASKEANAIRSSSDDYNELAVAMGGIDPPVSLRRAHAGLVKSLQLFSQMLDELQDGLRQQDTTMLQQISSGDTAQRVDELRATWRIAMTTEARRLGVEVPRRLTRVGRRTS